MIQEQKVQKGQEEMNFKEMRDYLYKHQPHDTEAIYDMLLELLDKLSFMDEVKKVKDKK